MKHSSLWISAIVAWSVFLLAAALNAAGPSDKGIQINYGATPLNSPYNGLPAHAILAAYATPTTITGNDFASALRPQLYTERGGRYNGSAQTAYALVNGVTTQRGQGQAGGYFGIVQGIGKGNAFFGSGSVTCYGGGEVSLPSSTPECSALGEFEADQGPAVWEGTLTTPISSGTTTLHYTTTAHAEALGARALFSKNHVHTDSGTISSYTTCTDSVAGACSVTGGTCPLGATSSCTVVTFAGSSLPTSTPDHWYFKSVIQNDDYSGACQGDDVPIPSPPASGAKCVGHWYKVGNVPDSTHLVLSGVFDQTNLTTNVGNATWLMVEGVEVLDVNTAAATLTIPSNSLNWANADQLWSPPDHYMGMVGVNLILRKTYKTGQASAASIGARIVNDGPGAADYGIQLGGGGVGVGGWRTGIQIANLNATTGQATRAIDIDNTAAYALAINADCSFAGVGLGQIRMGASGQNVICGAIDRIELAGQQVAIEQGIAVDGGGKKIATFTDTNTLAALTAIDETVTWTTPFRGAGYVPICVVYDPSKKVTLISLSGQTSAHVIATVYNTDASGHANFTVQCFAEYMGN